jgi:adenylosuccinate lyase
MSRAEIDATLDPVRFTGRAAEQVDNFLANEVEPVLASYEDADAVPELRA